MRVLRQTDPLVDDQRRPVKDVLRFLNDTAVKLDGLAATYSLAASYPESFTPPFIEADDLGQVVIAAHTRFYGDGTSVDVDGGTISTGEAAGSVLRFYYDDSQHAGGAVTYLYTVDPTAAPIQSGARHVVGKVEIPASGTQDGTYLLPPGAL